MQKGQMVWVFGRIGEVDGEYDGNLVVKLDRPYNINNRRKKNSATSPRSVQIAMVIVNRDYVVPF